MRTLAINYRSLYGLLIIGLLIWNDCHLGGAQYPLVDPFNPYAYNGQEQVPGVNAIAVQTDGTIVLAGTFNELGGKSRQNIGRVMVDGTLDESFSATADYTVRCLATQSDGKLIVGGAFTNLCGQVSARLGRLNRDGSLDASFASPIANLEWTSVAALFIQPDGKILVGGPFVTTNSTVRTNLIRLNSDGTIDTTFNATTVGAVNCFTMQPDQKILLGGDFTVLNGQAHSRIGRLHLDGSVDETFNPIADNSVTSIALHPDGGIIVGSGFSNTGGVVCTSMGRLGKDGTVDTNFMPRVNYIVRSLLCQMDGKILVGGDFRLIGDVGRTNFGVLNAAGILDTNFECKVGISVGFVQTMALQSDGKILFGGDFAALGDQYRMNAGRLNSLTPAYQTLSCTTNSVTWLLGGSSPIPSWVVISYSSNGTSWIPAGVASQIPGGWELNGVQLPSNVAVRAQGYIGGGLMMAQAGAPGISWQSDSVTNDYGTTVAFSVEAGGSVPIFYEWFKDGVALTNDAHVSGSGGSLLRLTAITRQDIGSYIVIVSNAFGCVSSPPITLSIKEPVISSQPSNMLGNFGDVTNLTFGVLGTPPLVYQWYKDGVGLRDGNNASLIFTNLSPEHVGEYYATASNNFGSVTSVKVTVTARAAVDNNFQTSAYGLVYTAIVQTDGKIIIGGINQTQAFVHRLNTDGSLDAGFKPDVLGSRVTSAGIQPDGKIIIGGNFTSVNGSQRTNLARLNSDGSLDAGFKLDVGFNSGTAGSVMCLTSQSDGKILAGGWFSELAGQPRNYIGRLLSDGTLDASFIPGIGGSLYSIAQQSDGKILVGGLLLARLNPDGSGDNSFNVLVPGTIYAMVIQPDGKILVGGSYPIIAGVTRNGLARLNADGTPDNKFNPALGGTIYSIALQLDGKVLVGGFISNLATKEATKIGRLNPDGSLDKSFTLTANNTVRSLVLQPDGKVIITGEFNSFGNVSSQSGIGRIQYSLPSKNDLKVESGMIAWTRTGSGPEVNYVLFDYSFDQKTWVSLGAGARIADGWQLTGITPPTNATIRAIGSYNGGYCNGGNSLVMAFAGAPIIIRPPLSVTNDFGTEIMFAIESEGTAPLAYRWYRNRQPIYDDNHVSGSGSALVHLQGISQSDSGEYSVVVSNISGSVTSAPAFLVVKEPLINLQPVGVFGQLGSNVLFSVSAIGTTPMDFIWRKDGTNLHSASDATLSISNLQYKDAGYYDVIVSNSFGVVTSKTAALVFNTISADSTFNPMADNNVHALAIQPDGKILVGGAFTNLCNQPRSRFARLNPDGSLDASINIIANDDVHFIVNRVDGRTIIGGDFSQLDGQNHLRLGCVETNGTILSSMTVSANSNVYSALSLANSYVYVGGQFSQLKGMTCNGIGYFSDLGSVSTVNPMQLSSSQVFAMQFREPGKLLLGGKIFLKTDVTQNVVCMLSGNSVDTNFLGTVVGTVNCLAIQSNRRLLVGGTFNILSGASRSNLGRLLSDGTIDETFQTEADGEINSIVIQADGKILVGGAFHNLGGAPCEHIGRLNQDGTLDTFFCPQANGEVYALAIQNDGKILVGGDFTLLGGQECSHLARLNNNTQVSESFNIGSNSITWSREGGGPEFSQVIFEYSTDRLTWKAKQNAVPVQGGWKLDNYPVPFNAVVRAYGLPMGGYHGGSGGVVKLLIGAPIIAQKPNSSTNHYGNLVSLGGGASGSLPLYYKWIKNGEMLNDGDGVVGTETPFLTVTASQTARYSVLVSNVYGSVTSAVALVYVMATNDLFANRITVPGITNCMRASNTNASWEIGETNLGGRSLWWSWKPVVNGQVSVDTIGSSINTVLAVYSGTTLSNLTLIATDIGSASNGACKVLFPATAGSEYQITVDGLSGARGSVVVNLQHLVPQLFAELQPSNNIFQFQVTGPIGSNYVLELSSNLSTWVPVYTNMVPVDGKFIFTDEQISNAYKRFYRAVSP